LYWVPAAITACERWTAFSQMRALASSRVYYRVMNRRKFVLGTLAGLGALGVGWSVLPRRQRMNPGDPLPTTGTQQAFNGWVKIDADGIVTIVMGKSEMGQGTHTGLAMLLAEELDADCA
jgi:isoquinoline 1-oxidoreductase beta subunit